MTLPHSFQSFASKDLNSHHEKPILPLQFMAKKKKKSFPNCLWPFRKVIFISSTKYIFFLCVWNKIAVYLMESKDWKHQTKTSVFTYRDPEIFVHSGPTLSWGHTKGASEDFAKTCPSRSWFINPSTYLCFRDIVDEGSGEWVGLVAHRDPCRQLIRCTCPCVLRSVHEAQEWRPHNWYSC